jgi:uncharacterized protein
MILLAMSDSHNNRGAIRAALQMGLQRGAHEVIHCGDVSTVALLEEFAGWTLHLTFGNMDRDVAGMRARIARLGNRSECGQEIRMDCDGLSIGMVHGDHADLLQDAIHERSFDFIFHGHTHHREEETIGRSRIINPGALGGAASEPRSFCLLDTATRSVEFHTLEDDHLSPE